MLKFFRQFKRCDEGSVTMEAVIILPVILVVFMGTFTYFDVFRAKSQSLKANYAISDLISRENNVTPSEMQGYGKVFRYLTQSSNDSWIRVTVVRCRRYCDDPARRRLARFWSREYPTGSVPRLTTTEIRASYENVIPNMYDGEYLVMVESSARYVPPFFGEWTGIYPRTLSDLVVTKPRDGPKICFNNEDCNPGDS